MASLAFVAVFLFFVVVFLFYLGDMILLVAYHLGFIVVEVKDEGMARHFNDIGAGVWGMSVSVEYLLKNRLVLIFRKHIDRKHIIAGLAIVSPANSRVFRMDPSATDTIFRPIRRRFYELTALWASSQYPPVLFSLLIVKYWSMTKWQPLTDVIYGFDYSNQHLRRFYERIATDILSAKIPGHPFQQPGIAWLSYTKAIVVYLLCAATILNPMKYFKTRTRAQTMQ